VVKTWTVISWVITRPTLPRNLQPSSLRLRKQVPPKTLVGTHSGFTFPFIDTNRTPFDFRGGGGGVTN
jgi:hypothetical protein